MSAVAMIAILSARAAWLEAAALAVALFLWLARENWLRTRFKFMRGPGIAEVNFDLGAEPSQLEIAADGSCAIFVTLDGAMSMRDSGGRELWKRPAEASIQAVLPVSGGRLYYATGDEIVLCDGQGNIQARLGFSAPPFRQSYRLLFSENGLTLLLHTPWFLHFIPPDLESAGQRISSEETGHYMKYAALSPGGDRVFFAGAKLLEEEQNAQARWGCWKLLGSSWVADWADAVESYGNSHLRGVSFSKDGLSLSLELFQERYEVRILNIDGSLRTRRDGVEHPLLSPDASLVLWESQLDGLQLVEPASKLKLWSRKSDEKIRLKRLHADGSSFLIEGRHLMGLNRPGATIWEAWFQVDPFRFAGSADGKALAMIRQKKGAMVRLPAI